MTSDKRLNQIEPILADVVQKVDRLIEGQGQIVEIATRADQNADTAARGVANLTLTVQQGFTDFRQDIMDLKNSQVRIEQDTTDLKGSQVRVERDITDVKAGQTRLESNQQEILTLLRERLS